MAIYVHGDIHGNFAEVVDFRNKMKLTKEDTIILLGDVGICWRKDKKDMQQYVKIWEEYENTPMLYFIDGNHENFDILLTLPDGIVSEHIVWLQRGTVRTFEGKKCLFIGGAESVDKFRRIEHLSWWEEETISPLLPKLVHAGYYDYVFTHTCPLKVLQENKYILTDLQVDQETLTHNSEKVLQEIEDKIMYKHWFFGHYHKNVQLNSKFTCLYDRWEVLE